MTAKYLQLIQDFPPRTITSEAELDQTIMAIDKLLDSFPLTADESDYLNVLGTLVADYESRTKPIPDIYGSELLKVLIAERGLLQKDLVPIFKTESIVSDVLNGKRQLTTRHIQELSSFFKLPHGVFFPRQENLSETA